jgi:hypothetical protein
MGMSATQDEMNQLRGAVIVWYGIGQDGYMNRTFAYWKLFSAMPLRGAAFHGCTNSSALDPMRWMMSKVLESELLLRVRFHNGKPFWLVKLTLL